MRCGIPLKHTLLFPQDFFYLYTYICAAKERVSEKLTEADLTLNIFGYTRRPLNTGH
jgi:hypothetical protein